jgi:hypothetical protein
MQEGMLTPKSERVRFTQESPGMLLKFPAQIALSMFCAKQKNTDNKP